ncbi:MAG: methyltransferase domain-containing protein [Acidobacteria bacterium]|nr:methyltransferase domain-containing protein [Acidobacteriota bacterium]
MRCEPMDFSRRAHLRERMDEPCTYKEFRACLHDLEKVNTMLRGYKPSLDWVSRLLREYPDPVHIVDVGCGGGGMLRAIQAWAHMHHRTLRLTGIDLNPHAARACQEFSANCSEIEWITGNAFSYDDARSADIIMSSLLTHHLAEHEIVRFLAWMEENTIVGWFVNDLRRSPISYYSFKSLAWVMRWHPFVRHDGPVSIRRSFLPEDWVRMCTAAGLRMSEVEILEMPFGRLCISRRKQ